MVIQWMFILCLATILISYVTDIEAEARGESSVLTLDATNFSDDVSKHPFVVIKFYGPWCGQCKHFEPEYEKIAVSLLYIYIYPPIILAKVDANEKSYKALAGDYGVRGFPTLKVIWKGGANIQDYNHPHEADGIVEYLKKQSGPTSVEIKSAEEASSLIGDKKVFIVGVFSKLEGDEFRNFITVAEELCSDYEFGHTN